MNKDSSVLLFCSIPFRHSPLYKLLNDQTLKSGIVFQEFKYPHSTTAISKTAPFVEETGKDIGGKINYDKYLYIRNFNEANFSNEYATIDSKNCNFKVYKILFRC